jgi:hypothetical protein
MSSEVDSQAHADVTRIAELKIGLEGIFLTRVIAKAAKASDIIIGVTEIADPQRRLPAVSGIAQPEMNQ